MSLHTHDDLRYRVIEAARVLNNEIERYRSRVESDIKDVQRLLETEDDISLIEDDKRKIKALTASFPRQLSIQLKRWLKNAGTSRRGT